MIVLPRADWDRISKIGIENAIVAILQISEYNRTCQQPYVVPGSYFESLKDMRSYERHPPAIIPGWMPLETSRCGDNEHIYKPLALTFNGYVLAGGAALRTVYGYDDWNGSDADYYPYTDDGYATWLRDIASICSRVERAEYHTTVYPVVDKNVDLLVRESAIKYHQIIHRQYKQPWEVVCGFDHSCCKAWYDGKDTWLTLDCALCLMYGINPIDWRAESPTHIIRALKYEKRGFRMVVPEFPIGRFRFGAGVIQNTGGRWKMWECIGMSIRIDDKPVPISNPEEFPPLPIVDSKYASDYEPNQLRMIGKDNLYPCLQTVESTIKPRWDIVDVNLRACAHGFEQYYIAHAHTCDDMAAGLFMLLPEDAIDAQQYRRWYMHRERAMAIEAEYTKISNRRKTTHTKKERTLNKTTGFQLHRCDDVTALAELCKEMKALYDDYRKVVTEREVVFAERRRNVAMITHNPGKQNNASFNPIRRESYEAYWGKSAHVNTWVRISAGVLYIQLLVKRGEIPWVPKDILKMIRNICIRDWLDNLIAVGDINIAVESASRGQTGQGIAIGHAAVHHMAQGIAIGYAAHAYNVDHVAIGTAHRYRPPM
jgi:hypothetical protein